MWEHVHVAWGCGWMVGYGDVVYERVYVCVYVCVSMLDGRDTTALVFRDVGFCLLCATLGSHVFQNH